MDTTTGNDQRETPMSVTFSAIDAQGDFVRDIADVRATNHHAIQIELLLGFRASGDDDIPAGQRSVDEFVCALMAAVLSGGGLGSYGNELGELCAEAYRVGAVAIAWA